MLKYLSYLTTEDDVDILDVLKLWLELEHLTYLTTEDYLDVLDTLKLLLELEQLTYLTTEDYAVTLGTLKLWLEWEYLTYITTEDYADALHALWLEPEHPTNLTTEDYADVLYALRLELEHPTCLTTECDVHMLEVWKQYTEVSAIALFVQRLEYEQKCLEWHTAAHCLDLTDASKFKLRKLTELQKSTELHARKSGILFYKHSDLLNIFIEKKILLGPKTMPRESFDNKCTYNKMLDKCLFVYHEAVMETLVVNFFNNITSKVVTEARAKATLMGTTKQW